MLDEEGNEVDISKEDGNEAVAAPLPPVEDKVENEEDINDLAIDDENEEVDDIDAEEDLDLSEEDLDEELLADDEDEENVEEA